MFDDELPAEECELLARRLSRDEQLKSRWGRYAAIGAAIRAERGVRLNSALAGRVRTLILAEPALAATASGPGARRSLLRLWQPVVGAAVAAGVAAVSILWLRSQGEVVLSARADPPASPAAAVAVSNHGTGATAADSYVVPRASKRATVVPSTELANYVVAHSVFSSPVARRNLLSAFMTSESAAPAEEQPATDEQPPPDAHGAIQ
jgi:negative regulator of sigma E activity